MFAGLTTQSRYLAGVRICFCLGVCGCAVVCAGVCGYAIVCMGARVSVTVRVSVGEYVRLRIIVYISAEQVMVVNGSKSRYIISTYLIFNELLNLTLIFINTNK